MGRPAFPLAIAQSAIVRDVATNGRHIRELMAEAQQAGARLVHFPEAALSGAVKTHIASWAEVAWPALDNELASVCDAARELGLFVVLGSNHSNAGMERPFNSLVVIADTGEIVARYDKRYCSFSEATDWYAAGTAPCVFEVDGMQFGCLNCVEIHFPELLAEYERMGVDCVLFSAYSGDPVFWIEARGLAAVFNLWISVSAPAALAKTLPGGLIGPNGLVIIRSAADVTPAIKMAWIDKQAPAFDTALNKARPWRRRKRETGLPDTTFRQNALRHD